MSSSFSSSFSGRHPQYIQVFSVVSIDTICPMPGAQVPAMILPLNSDTADSFCFTSYCVLILLPPLPRRWRTGDFGIVPAAAGGSTEAAVVASSAGGSGAQVLTVTSLCLGAQGTFIGFLIVLVTLWSVEGLSGSGSASSLLDYLDDPHLLASCQHTRLALVVVLLRRCPALGPLARRTGSKG